MGKKRKNRSVRRYHGKTAQKARGALDQCRFFHPRRKWSRRSLKHLNKRIVFGFVGTLAVFWILLLLLSQPAAQWLKEEAESRVALACEPCKLSIGKISFGISPPSLIAHDVKFESGDPRDSAVFADAQMLVIPVSPSSLGGLWKIGLVKAAGLNVTVHEGDLSLPSPEPTSEGGSTFFECAGVQATNSSFTYRKDSSAGAAILRLPEVEAEIGAFGSFGDWKKKAIEGKAEATLESSGRVSLTVLTKLFEEGPWVDVDLRIRGQRLHEVNAYFRKGEGVSLKGTLMDAKSTVKVRNGRADGHAELRYKGLEVMFHPNRERGALAAIFTNLGALIKVNKGNSGDPPSERHSGVVTARHKKESVVSFILRTLKEAALRVAT